MAYKESIATELRQLLKDAPEGTTTEYTLEHFDQEDVADTVNYFSSTNPKLIQETFADYSGKATITIMK